MKNHWYLWQIVKSWDMPRLKVEAMLDKMGLEVHGEGREAYIEKHLFRSWLFTKTSP